MRSFENCHPAVNLFFFGSVMVLSVFFLHPICLAISLFCAFLYVFRIKGKRAGVFSLLYTIPLLIAASLFNVAFNHEGMRILTYLPDGNPVTLESIFYGAAASVMIASIVAWFSVFHVIMTGDKLMVLFGRFAPSISLLLSMILRFVPRFSEQMKEITAVQKCAGKDVTKGNLPHRIKTAVSILSILITRSLEGAVDTADSMKSRGYGLAKRVSFTIFIFHKRDLLLMVINVVLLAYLSVGIYVGALEFRYFPTFAAARITPYSASVFAAYFCLCITPYLGELLEDLKFKNSSNKRNTRTETMRF